MKLIRIFLLSVTLFASLTSHAELFASGIDLSPLYGSRQNYLGGHQIAISTDAYAPFYNPAAMGATPGGQVAIGLAPLVFQNEGPLGPTGAQRKSTIGFGPLFYLGTTYQIHDRLTLGFAVYPTALQGAKYENVDYNAALTDKNFSVRLMRIEFSPSWSLKIVDHVYLGAAYRFGYTKYDKEAGLYLPVGTGVHTDLSVSEWDAKGFKIGGHLDKWRGLSLGVSYRFKTVIYLDGTAKVDGGAGPTPYIAYQRAVLPAQLQLGGAYEWIPKTLLTALTYQYTLNSAMQYDDTNLTAPRSNPAGAGIDPSLTRQPIKHRNGHTINAGLEYSTEGKAEKARGASDSLNFWRTGFGITYDKATTRKNLPSAVLAPSADYLGGNIGGQYIWGNHTFGLAANYGQYKSVSTTVDSPPLIPATVFPGTYKIWVFLGMLDYQYRF